MPSFMRLGIWLTLTMLVLAACGSDDSSPTTTRSDLPSTTETSTLVGGDNSGNSTTPTSTDGDTDNGQAFATSTSTSTLPRPVSPLTGQEIVNPATAQRRVLAVKIDNHENARPQSGLELADAVYEIPVEGRFTRFISLWHQQDSEYVGPMRSGRPTDASLLQPLGATFTISGAQGWVINRINRAGVPLIGEVRPETFRVSSRRAPHNLYVNTNALRIYADGREFPDLPPDPLWEFGSLPASVDRAAEVTLEYDPTNQVTWVWNGQSYRRLTNGFIEEWVDLEEETGVLEADVLVILFAARYWAGPPAGMSGSSVPAFETVGNGRALVAAGGTIAEGSWTREDADQPFTLTTSSGAVLPVPPGRPWISIFPDDRSVSW